MRRHAIIALMTCAALPQATLASGPSDAAGALHAWADAYGTMDGSRTAAVYTENARLWGTTSREQNVGRASIEGYFSRPRPGVTSISVAFGDYGVQPLGDRGAVASGHYTFTMKRVDGTETQLPARFSMSFVRGDDGIWRIADHHSSPLSRAP